MKKIVIISAVKNECDIIESFCRYNLSFCDALLIYENHKSIDNTREIIEKLIDEGLPIFFEAEEHDIYYEDAKGLLAKVAVRKYEADLIVQLDVDEFLCCTDGSDPRSVLESLEEDVEYQIPWRTYVYEETVEEHSSIDFLPYRFEHYRNPAFEEAQGHAGKTIASKYLMKTKHARFVHGGHWLFYPQRYRAKAKIEVSKLLYCAHYPIRSRKQIINKAVLNYINKWTQPLPERPDKGTLDVFQLGLLFNDIKEDGNISVDIMRYVSITYSLFIIGDKKKIDKLLKNLGDKITIKGAITSSFCADRLKMRYNNTWVGDSGKSFFQATLNILDDALQHLDNESRKVTHERDVLQHERNYLAQQLDNLDKYRVALEEHRDALIVQSEARARQIDEIYASWSWRLGNRLMRALRFFVPRKR